MLPIMVIIHTMMYENTDNQTRDRENVSIKHFLHRWRRQSGTVRYRSTLIGTDMTNILRRIQPAGISNTDSGSSFDLGPKKKIMFKKWDILQHFQVQE